MFSSRQNGWFAGGNSGFSLSRPGERRSRRELPAAHTVDQPLRDFVLHAQHPEPLEAVYTEYLGSFGSTAAFFCCMYHYRYSSLSHNMSVVDSKRSALVPMEG